MTINKSTALAGLIGVAFLLAAVVVLFQGARPALGSTIQGNEYQATTTGSGTSAGVTITTDAVVFTGTGALASVILTGANTGYVNIYDATTTNVNARTNNTPTSTIHIASLPASMAAGTFVFDAEIKTGLLIDLVSGIMPTTTVTYRR